MRFSILGPLLVHDAAGRPVTVGGARLRTLLTLLLLRPGQRVTTEELTEAIWAGSPPSAADNALQALVSRLRRALGEGAVIDGDASGYRLEADPEQVDLVRFESLARRGRSRLAAADHAGAARDLEAALALWRGPALADLTAHGLAEDTALRLSETHRAALEDHLAALTGLGRHAEVLPEAEALVSREPHRERPLELLVRSLAATGRTADALAAYDRFRDRLAGELGLDPSARLRDLHLRLLRGELDAPPPPEGAGGPAGGPAAPRPDRADPAPPLHLPVTLTSFVPREAEVEAALGRLSRGRLATLTGPGGAGKTRLAIETASALAARAPHLLARGGWFVELASRAAEEIPQALASALDLRDHAMIQTRSAGSAPAPPMERVAAFFGEEPALLVLDNCEHLVGEVARTVEPLLARCPRLRILATSREPLGVPGEQLLAVPSLALPPEGATAEEAVGYPSVALFTERAAAVSPGFRLGPGNVAHVVRVTRELDGMPLALELAAARLSSMTTAQLAERLCDRFRLLTGGARSALPRHRTLRAVVDWSWELLDEPERRLLRRLSLFAGGATLEAVEHVCADPGTEGEIGGHDVWTVLFALVDKSLVVAENPVRDDAPPRYRQLETVRAYGAERLRGSGEEDDLRDRHARYVRDLWRRCDPLLRGPAQRELIVRLDAEADNCNPAVRWALRRRDADLALDLVEYIQWYWTLTGSWRQLGRYSEEVLDMVGDQVPPGRAVAYASCLFHRTVDPLTDGAAMLARLDRVEAVLEEAGERPEEHPMLVYGLVYRALVHGPVADTYDRLVAASDQPDPWMRAMVRLLLSLLDIVSGRVGPALERAAGGLAEFRACGDAWGMCQALAQMSDVHRYGDLERSRELLTEGMRLAEDTDLRGMAAVFRSRRVQVLTDLGDLETARRDLCLLLESEESFEREHRLLLRLSQAHWLREAGDLSGAREVLDGLGADVAELDWISPASLDAAWRTQRAVVLWLSGEAEEAWREAGRGWWLAAHGLAPMCAEVVDVFALMLAEKDPARAARLLGCSEALRGVPDEATPYVVRARERVRRGLGEEEYARLLGLSRDLGAGGARRYVDAWLAPIVPDPGGDRRNWHL
ncbi:BTAD domain-containing putative transcriptional regulator [Nocardiopsis sp. FR26]|uniref:AfsR/SARP family transcriptional regulator n=1 Tax=Nocardiopsis sp. FR26 TaxID=2605987 RepID=UPI00135820CF|nr:BTAD domain-containing putative transcriptional regulator [Nocardiopsis sp. FR26]